MILNSFGRTGSHCSSTPGSSWFGNSRPLLSKIGPVPNRVVKLDYIPPSANTVELRWVWVEETFSLLCVLWRLEFSHHLQSDSGLKSLPFANFSFERKSRVSRQTYREIMFT